MAGPNWGMNRSTDYRVLMAMAAGVSLLAAATAVFVVVERLVGVALIAVGVGWLAVALLRRELRIRHRLADVAGTRPTPPRPAMPAPTQPVVDPAADAATRSGGT